MASWEKLGREGFYNIAFKYGEQAHRGEYGLDFVSSLRLGDFIDLSTVGPWQSAGGTSEAIGLNRPAYKKINGQWLNKELKFMKLGF